MEPVNNLVQAIQRSAQVDGQGVTFIDDSIDDARFITYRELLHESRKLAAFMQAQGVENGHRVALMLPNNDSFYLAFIGALLLEAIPVAIYPPIRLARLDEWESKTRGLLDSVAPTLIISEMGMASLGHRGIAEYPCYTVKEREKYDPLPAIPQIDEI